jgi:Ca2+-transporting ATPase
VASTRTWPATGQHGPMNRPASSPPAAGSPRAALPADPSLLDAAAVLGSLGVDPASGLGSAEAAGRLARVGRNRLDPTAHVPAWRKLLAQFADPLTYLLLVAIAISVHGHPFLPGRGWHGVT